MANSNLKVSPVREQATQPVAGRKVLARIGHMPHGRAEVLTEPTFHALLTHERRRAERSRKPFVLMLLEMHPVHAKSVAASLAERVSDIIAGATRETDLLGWYEEGRILAVIFAELNVEENSPVAELLRSKIETVLLDSVGMKAAARIVITTHVFPESWNQNGTERPADLKLYPDLSQKTSKKRLPIVVKRGIDVLGSFLLLLILSPILAAIAIAIKLTSKGPVIFEQERLGQFGTKFKCLKFRTMYSNND